MALVLGMDTGLATFGVVAVETDGMDHRCVGSHYFSSALTGEDGTWDCLVRTAQLSDFLDGVLRIRTPVAVAAEAISYPKHHHAVALISMGWAVLASKLREYRLDRRVVYAGPSKARTAVAGPRRAATAGRPQETKEDFEARARGCALGGVRGARDMLVGVKGSEHLLDALVMFSWGMTTKMVRGAVLR